MFKSFNLKLLNNKPQKKKKVTISQMFVSIYHL